MDETKLFCIEQECVSVDDVGKIWKIGSKHSKKFKPSPSHPVFDSNSKNKIKQSLNNVGIDLKDKNTLDIFNEIADKWNMVLTNH